MAKTPLRFEGCILFFSSHCEAVRAQLQGHDITLTAALPLRDDISTDEITPVVVMMTYDARLGKFPYVGFKVEGVCPIGNFAVQAGGFTVTVAGKRYGKGSSRESSPLAVA